MDYFEVIVDAVTNERTVRPYTEEEVAAVIAARSLLVRQARNSLLSTVFDPVVSNPIRWAELTAAKKTAWTAYRTALLDVPQQPGFPEDVIWPTQPSA